MFELFLMISIIIFFSELIKRIKIFPSSYIPTLNIAFGIIISVSYNTLEIGEAVIQGIIIGLTAIIIYKCITKFSKLIEA